MLTSPAFRVTEARSEVWVEEGWRTEENICSHVERNPLCDRTGLMLHSGKLSDPRGKYPYLVILARVLKLLQGLKIPEVLQPYMGGRDFIPFTKELPKMYQRKEKK